MKLSSITITNVGVFLVAIIGSSLISCAPRPPKIGKGNVIKNQINLQVNQKNNNFEIKPEFEFNGPSYGRKITVKCRGVDACLRVCAHLNSVDCKSYPVDKVVSLWKQNIESYTEWEPFKKDLEVIATDVDVSSFLKNTDKDNAVLVSLLKAENSFSQVNCPFATMKNINFGYSNYSNSKKHYTALHISPIVQEGDDVAMQQKTALENLEKAQNSQAKAEQNFSKVQNEKAQIESRIRSLKSELPNLKLVVAQKAEAVSVAQSALSSAESALSTAEANLKALPAGQTNPELKAQRDQAIKIKDEKVALLNTAKAEQTEAQSAVISHENNINQGEKLSADVAILEEKSKTIVNSQVAPFEVNIFAGFIKQCFGHNQRTFSQMAAEIENQSAVDIGHTALFKGCGGNSECIRLAYCAVGSDRLWSYVSEDIKAPGCEYDSFVHILSPEKAEE